MHGQRHDEKILNLRHATIDDKEWIQCRYLAVVPTLYAESTASYCAFWWDSFFEDNNEIGFFSLRKEVVVFEKSGQHIGFAVITYKRGNSAKISPFILTGMRRELMAAWRLLEQHVKHVGARKLYFDIPSRHWTLFSLLDSAGVRIEAHLRKQYSNEHDSVVLGKILDSPRDQVNVDIAQRAHDLVAEKFVEWTELTEQYRAPLQLFVQGVLASSYDQLDEKFISSIYMGTRNQADGFNSKGKYAYVMLDEATMGVTALCVLTPKRGGALKLGPFQFAAPFHNRLSISDALTKLIGIVRRLSTQYRKLYAVIPCHDGDLQLVLRTAGFEPEGVLQEPYKVGVDFMV